MGAVAPGEIHLPNAWDVGNYGFNDPGDVVRMREPGVYPVFGFGAISLIRRKAFEAGVRYERVPGYEFAGGVGTLRFARRCLGSSRGSTRTFRRSMCTVSRNWQRRGIGGARAATHCTGGSDIWMTIGPRRPVNIGADGSPEKQDGSLPDGR